MNAHQIELGLAIALFLACVAIIWQNGIIVRLHKKNEAQRQLIEAQPAKPEPPHKPSRIRVYVPGTTPASHVVYGSRLQYGDNGRLAVVDEEDKLAASFGPGWIAAIVEQEPKTTEPNPLERPKPTPKEAT
jgi:hypothetical protein